MKINEALIAKELCVFMYSKTNLKIHKT